MIGYSSHGLWCPLEEIYKVEEERENIYDESHRRPYLQKNKLALWVCYDPKYAVRYLRDAEFWDMNKFPPTRKELDQLIRIDLTDTVCIDEDGENGYLHIR